PRLGLGDADGGLVAGEDERRRLALLRLAAVAHDRADRAHIRLDDDAAGDAAGARHRLDYQHGVEDREAGPAIVARDRHAEEAGLLEEADILPGVLLGAVDLGGARRELLLGEAARPLLQTALRRAQGEIHLRSFRGLGNPIAA